MPDRGSAAGSVRAPRGRGAAEGWAVTSRIPHSFRTSSRARAGVTSKNGCPAVQSVSDEPELYREEQLTKQVWKGFGWSRELPPHLEQHPADSHFQEISVHSLLKMNVCKQLGEFEHSYKTNLSSLPYHGSGMQEGNYSVRQDTALETTKAWWVTGRHLPASQGCSAHQS